MNVVSFGGGTNSTAMLIGMYEKRIPVDLILFADPGAEMPHTYEHVEIMNKWLKQHGMPEITVVEYTDRDGNRLTLEQDCLLHKNLPSIAYGFKTCSQKHKIGPQDKFCNSYSPCIDLWGKFMNDAIGYRGWCKRCRHGVIKGNRVTCNNKSSQFYNLDTTCLLCTPCLSEDKSKNNIPVEPISFD